MAETVRGLSIEIAADASKFKKELKTLKSETNSMKTEANNLAKSLELNYSNEKFLIAQKKTQEAIDKTAEEALLLKNRMAYLEEGGNVNTAEYAKLEAELSKVNLTAEELNRTLEKINNAKFQALGNEVQAVGKNLTSLGKGLSVVSAGATAAGVGLAKSALDAVSTADEIATLASQYGITATELQRLQYIALQSDVANDSLYKGLLKVRSAVADLASGSISDASNAVSELGLNLNGLSEGEQFNAIISALSNMEDKTMMVATANDIFGDKLANSLLPLINQGAGALAEYAAEFDTVGAMSDETIEALSKFDNVLNKIKTQLSNVFTQIGASLLPLMEQVASIVETRTIPKLERLSKWFQGLSLGQQELYTKILLIVAALGPLTLALGGVITQVGNLIKAIPAITSALNTLMAHPIVAIIAAIAVLLVVLYTQCESIREIINMIIGTLTDLLSTILTPILNLLKPVITMLQSIFNLLDPILNVMLIPLRIQLTLLQVPLKALGLLLNVLGKAFEAFGGFVKNTFNKVLNVVNIVLGYIENAINWCIDIVNGMIDGINGSLGWLGVNLDKLDHVKLKIDTDAGTISADVNSNTGDNFVYDTVDTTGSNNTVNNYDYSTENKTQNVTVTIENYAAEVDTDALIEEINRKLVEVM